ncbi:MAG: RNA-binding domain-containing protein [Akkermansia sp.]
MCMCSLTEEVKELIASSEGWREGLHLEFKASREKLSSDLWSSYSAFANTDGGIIVLGVEDNGRVVGVSNINAQLKALHAQLTNPQKLSINLSSEPGMIEVAQLRGKSVILIRVPKAQIFQKPVYLDGNPGKSFYRLNEQDAKCSADQLEQMLRDKSTVSRLERVISGCTAEAVDAETWRSYRIRMQQCDAGHPWVAYDDIALLEALGAYRGESADGEAGLTLAGLLMFGRDQAIRRYFPRYNINYYEYGEDADLEAGARWSHRITPDGTWEGNLYQFFFRVLPRIKSVLTHPFALNEDLSASGESGAYPAVREALANAIVHADYDGLGGVNISRYPSGLIFSNPGTLLIPRERLFAGGLSECRNPSLQLMFQRIGMVERSGSGVATILRFWAEQALCMPKVTEEISPARVTWSLPFVSLIRREDELQLRSKVGVNRYKMLDVVQRIILLLVDQQKISSHADLRELLPGVHPADISRTLGYLNRNSYIRSTGHGRATRYSLAEGGAFTDHGSGIPNSGAMSIPNNGASIPNSGASIPNNGASIPNSGAMSIPDSGAGIPNNGALGAMFPGRQFSARAEVLLAAYRCKKRHSPEELEELVLELCREDWMRLVELAEILNRSPEYLRSRAVQILCRLGHLRRRHAELKHADQAYRAV